VCNLYGDVVREGNGEVILCGRKSFCLFGEGR